MCQLLKFAVLCVIYFVCFLRYSEEARILASVPTPSYSHQVVYRPIWKELAKRGHEIVLLTTDPMPNKFQNIRQIDTSFSYEIWDNNIVSSVSSNSGPTVLPSVSLLLDTMNELNFKQLQHPEVQTMIHNQSEKFDLLMMEFMHPAHLALGDRFKVPIIGLLSMDAPNEIHEVMGNAVHPVLNSDMLLSFTYPLSFSNRVISTLFQMVLGLYSEYFLVPRLTTEVRKIVGKTDRSLLELMNDVDMLFLNTNPIFHPIRAMTPSTISFGGGSHLDSLSTPLPKDLKILLDNAPDGVIYFSLGTNIKSHLIHDETRQIFLQTFAELPYKVLWKFENEFISDKPDNVIIRKWFPQNDVFRHKNIKAFITQCGLQSMEEAILHHIPMVGLPFFADQPKNGQIMDNKGIGILLDRATLTKEKFKKAILEVIMNPKYKKKTVEIAELLTDVEMTGLEKVVWWTEYVIRNKGAKTLRNPVLDIPFYQYYLLDVIAFMSALCFIIFFGIYKILSVLKTKICKNKSKR